MPLSTSAKGRGTIIRALRELAHQQLADYPQVKILAHKVEELQQRDEFVICGQAGEWHGRAVILCTAVLDHCPHFEGWEEDVGRTMFWCITCDFSGSGLRQAHTRASGIVMATAGAT